MELQSFKSGRETLKAVRLPREAHQEMAAERGATVLSEYRRGRFFEVPGVEEPVRVYEDAWYVERANGLVQSLTDDEFAELTGGKAEE